MDPNPPSKDPRVLLAAERTLLAWIRTGIALMGFGFVVARFGMFLRELALAGGRESDTRVNAGIVGVVLVAAGVAMTFWAAARHVRLVREYVETGQLDLGSRGPVTVGVMSGLAGIVLVAILLGSVMR